MELLKSLLLSALENEGIKITFNNEELVKSIIESKCYKIINKIKTILDDETCDDESCFEKIEFIIQEFAKEKIYTNSHDFG